MSTFITFGLGNFGEVDNPIVNSIINYLMAERSDSKQLDSLKVRVASISVPNP